jgi:hypothetical protein
MEAAPAVTGGEVGTTLEVLLVGGSLRFDIGITYVQLPPLQPLSAGLEGTAGHWGPVQPSAGLVGTAGHLGPVQTSPVLTGGTTPVGTPLPPVGQATSMVEYSTVVRTVV